MIKPWKFLQAVKLNSCRVFDIIREEYISPKSGQKHDFYLLASVDWVNVIPLTAEQEIILVKQYRFGTKDFSLEIPGGMIDPGDTPARAAKRELLEETGFGGEEPILLGVVHPNPAIHTNRCYTYLIKNATFQKLPEYDSTEDIEVQIVPLSEIPNFISTGRITHALVIAAFYWLFSSSWCKGISPAQNPSALP
ncbi:MAG: NUDIX hydrolase [Thermodesulfobacteriota bacterium]